MAKEKGFYAVDLDGTLAIYDGWQGADHIGEPVPAMLAQVKDLLAKGERVKIFTARVSAEDGTHNQSRDLIEAWCDKHVGQKLEVTCRKEFSMIAFFDDRAIQVIANTGEPIVERAGRGALFFPERLQPDRPGADSCGEASRAARYRRRVQVREHPGTEGREPHRLGQRTRPEVPPMNFCGHCGDALTTSDEHCPKCNLFTVVLPTGYVPAELSSLKARLVAAHHLQQLTQDNLVRWMNKATGGPHEIVYDPAVPQIRFPSHMLSAFSSHDMMQGPCLCGAWHKLSDWSDIVRQTAGLGTSL